jgi:hypothetical protein
MAETNDSLSHTKWDCKYHIVFIQKCRRAAMYRELRKYLGEMFRNLAQQKECRIEEGRFAWGACRKFEGAATVRPPDLSVYRRP